jgi:ABC-type multidrug transport system ATPase subunit
MIGSSGCGKTTLLSCILGMNNLDDGIISVFGQKVVKDKRLKGSHRIGYMPQETALVGELTVKETVNFFGNIFEMNRLKLKERFKMIRNLLELPPDDLRVENCSGGEKRRVSFAAAIIHEPDLLILDEPTVGLDPLLREKIWDFLWNATRTTKLSVILTTHYIDEAQKSDTVGLMRNGVILTEDSPANIMERVGTHRLEDAFVEFCNQQTIKEKCGMKVEETLRNFAETNTEQIAEERKDEKENKEENRSFWRWQVITALLEKYFLQFKRQPA